MIFSKKILIFLILLTQIILGNDATSKIPKVDDFKNLPTQEKLDSLLKYGWKLRNVNPQLAIKFNKEAIKVAKKLENASTIAKAYNFLGVVYRNISEYDSSFVAYKKALEYAKIVEDSTQIAYSYNNIGGYYGYKGKYFLALQYIYKAIDIFNKIKNLRGLAFAKIQAGLWNIQLHDYELAKKHLLDVVKIRKKLHDTAGLNTARLLLGAIAIRQKNYTKAKKIYKQTLNYFSKNKFLRGVGNSLQKLGQIEYRLGNYRHSISLCKKSLSITRKTHDNISTVENYRFLALDYFKLKNIDSTFYYAELSYKTAKEKKYLEGLYNSLELLTDLNTFYGDAKKSIVYAKKLLKLKENLYLQDVQIKEEEFTKINELQNLEKRNAILENEFSQRNQFIFYSISLGIIFLLALFVLFLQKRKLNQKRELLRNALLEKDKLFTIVAKDLKEPFEALLSYSDLLLNQLEHSYTTEDLINGIQNMRTSARKLLDLVENLLQWARLQTGRIKVYPDIFEISQIINEVVEYSSSCADEKGIKIEFSPRKSAKCFCDKDLLETVLRNLINNAIKYSRKGDTIKITVDENPISQEVVITIQDSGIGMDTKTLSKVFSAEIIPREGTAGEKGSGLGLKLSKDLIKLNNGKIEIESQINKGTKVSIFLPMSKE